MESPEMRPEGMGENVLREISEAREALSRQQQTERALFLEQIVSERIRKKEDVETIGGEILRNLFLENKREENGEISGTCRFRGFEKLQKWIGLKDLIPKQGFLYVRVMTSDGKVIEGERGDNGSYYDSNGKYVAVYEGDAFRVSDTPFSREDAQSKMPKTALADSEVVRDFSPVSIADTVFLGDSYTEGYGFSVDGVKASQVLAFRGKESERIRREFDRYADANPGRLQGKRLSLLAGINDIYNRKDNRTILENLSYISSRSMREGMTVVICTIPILPAFDRTQRENARAVNREIRRLPASKIVDLEREVSENNQRYRFAGDGVHLRNYRPLARHIRRELNIS